MYAVSGPEYPSALPLLKQMTSEPRCLPVLIIGAAANGEVIPAEGYYRYVQHAASEMEVLDYKHMSHASSFKECFRVTFNYSGV